MIMITPRYAPAIGGVERHVSRVVEQLARRGYETTVLTVSHDIRLASRERVGHAYILRIPPSQCARVPLNALWWILLRLRDLASYDIVHFHDVTTLLWGLPLIICRLRRRVFITFHGFERDPVPVIWRAIRRMVARLVEGTMCVGQFIRQQYQVNCDEVTLGAVETVPQDVRGNGGAIFVGRLERDTGVLEHIRALEILKTKHNIDLSLLVCGSGRLSDAIHKRAISSGLSVNLLGVVRDTTVFMRQSSICLAGGYLSILEALSLGLPVIGIAVTPLKMAYLRSMRDAGAPISIQTTPEGVAREILRVLRDGALCQSLAMRGRAFAATRTWERVMEQYIDLWSNRRRSKTI